ncbi:hypothetical protein ACFZCY_10865 [Streptomyces sp. NPDC007983]|uniref:hypothetical protein n=1 Tax=Streptomyces sp. NPDC007983 TaxID=3364800 RepID=UPI0036E84E9A
MVTVSPDHTAPEPFDFDQEVRALVLGTAPRLFAGVQEFALENGWRDAEVAAWGMAYQDGHADVTSVDGRRRFSLPSPDRATRHFALLEGVTARLVWLAPPRAAAFDPAGAA